MRILIISILTFLIVSCSYTLEIRITEKESGSPRFEVKEASLFPKFRTAEIHEIVVYKVNDAGDKAVAGKVNKQYWRIECSTQCYLTELKYGKVPNGFVEKVEAQALKQGEKYAIGVMASGALGQLEFSI